MCSSMLTSAPSSSELARKRLVALPLSLGQLGLGPQLPLLAAVAEVISFTGGEPHPCKLFQWGRFIIQPVWLLHLESLTKHVGSAQMCALCFLQNLTI